MKYKDLHLEALYEDTPLKLAHWNCAGSCSCCVTEEDFGSNIWKDGQVGSFETDPYLIFKIAHNIYEFDEYGLPSEDNMICRGLPDDYNYTYKIYVLYGNLHMSTVRKICRKLQGILGDDYEVIAPKTKSHTIIIQLA